MDWNDCPESNGIAVRIALEWVSGMPRNTHSCHSRSISDIKPAMTKEKVISVWGPTNLITHKNVNGLGTLEIWEYHFASSDTICSVIFVQDRVARTECRPSETR